MAMEHGLADMLTADGGLARGRGQTEVVPCPRGQGPKRMKCLESSDVYPEGEVPVAHLQRRRVRTGATLDVEGSYDLLPVDDGY